MKPNREIRREAKEILLRGWYGKVASVFVTHYFIMLFAMSAVGVAFSEMNIQTVSDHMMAKLQAAQQGLGYAIPSLSAGLSMAGASLFMQMVGYLFGAIFMFGLATVLLKSVKNDSNRWFADSFGGFSRPLEVFWLIFLMNLKVMLWSLLFIVPGIVAMYRYRQSWYLKSENPDWGAFKCLAESSRIMKGHKWAAFCLDFSFIGLLLLYALVFIALSFIGGVLSRLAGEMVSEVVSMLAMLLFIWLTLRLAVYFFTARAVFYKSIGQDAECPAES